MTLLIKKPMIAWEWRSFAELSGADVYEVLACRQDVFILEQRCLYPDADRLDLEAHHLLGRHIAPVAALLDEQHNEGGVHAASLAAQLAKIADPALTPSARVLEQVRALGSSAAFGLQQSELHAAHFRASALLPAEEAMFAEMAAASLAEQAIIEQTQTGNFDDFVAAYNSSTLCCD